MTAIARHKLARRTSTLMAPGEELQAVIWALVIRPTFGPLASLRILFASASPFRAIVVTNRRLVVYMGGRATVQLKPEVVSELPRSTRIGPAHGDGPFGIWYETEALGERMCIRRDWFEEVAKADAGSDDASRL